MRWPPGAIAWMEERARRAKKRSWRTWLQDEVAHAAAQCADEIALNPVDVAHVSPHRLARGEVTPRFKNSKGKK